MPFQHRLALPRFACQPMRRKPTKSIGLGAALALVAAFLLAARAADESRQSEVAQRGAQVMPFSLKATTHIFTKTDDGGVQRVVVKDATDGVQTRLIREHLHEMQAKFERGDFSGPSHIHGDAMPGLAALKAAKPGDISFSYRDLQGGAELAYRTRDRALIAAIHTWFDAQISNHGAHAQGGAGERRGHASIN